MAKETAGIVDTLSSLGLLLQQDARLPSVVTLVTGEPLRTSWWSHPKGRVIFAVLSDLTDHPDVLFTKLLYGKVTLVHRQLWPALLAVASAGEPWQLRGLSQAARALRRRVDDATEPIRATGQAVKELELRLLAHAVQVHTMSGRHETALESWAAWRRHVSVKPLGSAILGRQQLQKAAVVIGASPSGLPWSAGWNTAT